jgi:hypothetical protein
MRTVSGLCLAVVLIVYGTMAEAATRYNTSKGTVLSACGGSIHTGNGQTGCTKCDPGLGICRDFNCSDGSHGVRKGCSVVVLKSGSSGKKGVNKGSGVTRVNGAGTQPEPTKQPIQSSGVRPTHRR